MSLCLLMMLPEPQFGTIVWLSWWLCQLCFLPLYLAEVRRAPRPCLPSYLPSEERRHGEYSARYGATICLALLDEFLDVFYSVRAYLANPHFSQ